MGFQLSFLTTASILLFFKSVDDGMQKLFRKRTLTVACEMSPIDQWGYIFLTLFRQGISLTIAVNLAALPATLSLFSQFPLMSLPYNLFFPFFVSISMLLLILGFIALILFPPLGFFIHSFNSFFTREVLGFTTHMPRRIDFYLETDFITPSFLICFLSFIFFFGLFINNKQKENFKFI